MLKGENHDFLPANEPGSCARCHKGGTVPFLDDEYDILEHAYTNYKLILNDRSWGIHNPGYINKLLQDSIDNMSAAKATLIVTRTRMVRTRHFSRVTSAGIISAVPAQTLRHAPEILTATKM